MADEPMRLRIDGGRWPAILEWLPRAKLHISALELHLNQTKVPYFYYSHVELYDKCFSKTKCSLVMMAAR